MSATKFIPVSPGRLNRPAWHRAYVAELGPVSKTPGEHGSITSYEVYLNRERIGTVAGTLKSATSSLRAWLPDRTAAGITQHGHTRFEAVDALVRSHLAEIRRHPIAA
ncbi:hypothetical protein [Arthrobacter sp. UYCo732]|uniref:hypothetical protein n=1 Tax=Arthrobacter sp. UYCo732 TaxID=3156336 RepID=UPI0033941CC7